MNDLAILAASYLGPAGYGNDLTGLHPWPAHLDAAFQQGDLAELHWSLLFASDPARFARMDLMSRLGLMAVELLDASLESMPGDHRDRVGVCLETCAGSLATDLRFLHTPRASLFAYTLPSTVIGEICIRYHLRGPVLCLLKSSVPGRASVPASPNISRDQGSRGRSPSPTASFETIFSPSALVEAVHWLEQGDAEMCLCLTSEAVDREVVAVWPEGLPLPQWHAGALLVGKVGGNPREYLLTPDPGAQPLAAVCQRLLGAAGRSPRTSAFGSAFDADRAENPKRSC
jgi:hypothetical protein